MKYIIIIILIILCSTIVIASEYSSTDFGMDMMTNSVGGYVSDTNYETTIGSTTPIGNISSSTFSEEVGYYTLNSSSTAEPELENPAPLQVENITHVSNTSTTIIISWNYTDTNTLGTAIYVNDIYNQNVSYPDIEATIIGLSPSTSYTITAIAFNNTGSNTAYNWTNSTENEITIITSEEQASEDQRKIIRRIMTNNTNNQFCNVFTNGGQELCYNETDYNNSINVNTYTRYINGIIKVLI